ncbi:MAG: glycosyltransferase family 39 protein [Victivallales bacterium]|nr:glycosyltransferase family 39 protein [Victivallales bacterium]
MKRWKIAFLIFLGGSALFLAGLQGTEFVKINCRFALFVHEMTGGVFGPFPVLYGEPYCDYLSPHTFLMYLASFLGGITMLTATLPSALAGGGVMAFTYLIGARISKRFGFFAVLMLMASYEFLCIARAPSPDMFVAFATVCTFYLMYTSELENKALRLLWLPLLFILGFVMRGPVGAVIPIGVVVAYYLTAGRWRTALAGGILGTLVLSCCLMLLIMAIHKYGGKELVKTFQETQIGSRLSSGKPVWFYFTNAMGSYALSYPLAFVVMAVYAWSERKKYFSKAPVDGYKALRQRLTGWFGIILLGMSIPGTKHLRYVLPALPAAALMAAIFFENPDKLQFFRKARDFLLKVCCAVPFTALFLVLAGWVVMKLFKLNIPVPVFLPAVLFMVLGIALIGGIRKVKNMERVLFIVALTVITFLVIKIMLIEPLENYFESSYDFVRKIEALRPADSKLCFCGIDRDGEALKYLINLKTFPGKYHIPEFVPGNEAEKLLVLPAGTLIVFKAGKEKGLNPRIRERLEEAARGDLGHRECILYRLKPGR